MPQTAIAVDLGGTSIKAALVGDGGLIGYAERCPTEAELGPDHVLDLIAALVRRLAAEAVGEIAGIGIGVPGNVDLAQTCVLYPSNLPGWSVVDVQAELRARLGGGLDALRVVVENDANAAGLGSAHYGAGRPFGSFLMATLGTGVGGAVIFEKRVFRGAGGGAGEFGHVSVDYEGPVAGSGVAGAVEAYVGQRYLSEQARRVLKHRPESLVHRLAPDPDEWTPEHLHEAAVEGDAAAREVLAWAGHKLGCALASAVSVLDIRKVVVGGGMSEAGEFVLGPAREALERNVMPGLRAGIEIVREPRGNEVGLLGAAHPVF